MAGGGVPKSYNRKIPNAAQNVDLRSIGDSSQKLHFLRNFPLVFPINHKTTKYKNLDKFETINFMEITNPVIYSSY